MTILLIGQLTADEYADWHRHLTPHLAPGNELVRADRDHDAEQVEVALVANPAHGALAAYPNLRFVQSLWAGVDRLLADASLPADLRIARLIDPELTNAMVECATASVFHLHRQFPAYRRQQDERRWRPLSQPPARERHVGVLGLGQLGRAVAARLAALGFTVSGWSRAPQRVEGVACHDGPGGFEAVARFSEILVNLLPLTPETAGLLNQHLFARLPQGAAIVNLARGGHLVEPDLLAALASGHVGHAILDVFTVEPLPDGHPFWMHPQVTILPHVAADTQPASAAAIALGNVAAYRRGAPVTGLVDRRKGY